MRRQNKNWQNYSFSIIYKSAKLIEKKMYLSYNVCLISSLQLLFETFFFAQMNEYSESYSRALRRNAC
jgi:hypothetical protein